MDYANPDALVSTDWLAEHLNDPSVRVIDASYPVPGVTTDFKAEHLEAHIPGAVYFDIEAICDHISDLPHMLPSAEDFAAAVGALGIGNEHRVVAYDAFGGYGAAGRAWWMFRTFGHDNVALLDGGFKKWRRENRPLESGAAKPEPASFTAAYRAELCRNADQMLANIESHAFQVIDVRSPGRFYGRDPEPRPGSRGGHIPGSVNLPYARFLDPDTGAFLPADKIAALFAEAGIDPAQPLAATCGSGVTATMPIIALYLLGHESGAVYDGSWAEWGMRADLPLETE